jgi:hypothetical protein
MTGPRTRIDTAIWSCWFRMRAGAPERLVARWRGTRYAHLVARTILTRFERREAGRLAADPGHLRHAAFAVHSQNGEDGIIAEIFRRIGSGHRTFVEIGASDGAENCTAHLVDQGWGGVWIEGDHERVRSARARTEGRPVTVVEAFVDSSSIVSVLDGASTPPAPDLLVVDVDGNDYWIWEAVASHYRPRVVVVEYNAVVGPRLRWVMPDDPDHRWDDTAWHGAGLSALARLGRRLGYVLVGCDGNGVNAFFVDRREAGPFSMASVGTQWVPPRYSLPYGHPVRRFPEFDVPALPEGIESGIDLRPGRPPARPVACGEVRYLDVVVRNRSERVIGCAGDHPVQLASWWVDADGTPLDGEPTRSTQLWRAAPGASQALLCRLRAPESPGRYLLRLGLVQEGVRWLAGADVDAGWWTVAADPG